MPQNRGGEPKRPQKFHPKNNQRGSQSLSNLNRNAETKASFNSGAKPKNANFQKTHRTYPKTSSREFPSSAPPQTFPNASPPEPPSYEESIHQKTPFSNQPLFSNNPPLLNNPYGMQGYPQNYQFPGTGQPVPPFSQPPLYSNHQPPPPIRPFSQPPLYSNHQPPPPRPFHSQNRFQYNGPPQQRFPQSGHNYPKKNHPLKSETPKPAPRTSLQNKSGEKTNSANDSKPKGQNKVDKPSIDINLIVRKLSDCDGFFSFLKDLSQTLDINSSDLLKIVREKSHVFKTIYDSEKKDSVVELCPKIELCTNHQENGCDVKDCSKIHMCEDFIFSNCTRNDCPLGHVSTFKSNHNVNILKKYYMSVLTNTALQQLFQKACKRTPSLKICFEYHIERCQFAENCKDIHICYSYVNNLGLCTNDKCTFSHNIRDSKITAVFKSLGISTNESPRDLLKILKDKCIDNVKEKENINDKEKSKATSVSDDKQESLDKDSLKDKSKKNKETKKAAGGNQQAENSTVHCINFHGSVKVPKVCMNGMKLSCKFAHNGCHYLHCRHKSHWQFGNDNKWYNFHLYHSQIIDSKFSDPNCKDVNLPKLDFARLNATQRNLITVLGKKNLNVDFKKMTLYCESSDTTYSLRNLTTDSSVLAKNDDDLDNYTVFKWYFKDDDGKYKLYDNSDSSSTTIENAYIKDPNSITKFKSKNFSYSIDFVKMTQENDSTKKIRPLRRRAFIPRNEKNNDTNKKASEVKTPLPALWDDMKNESIKRVKLSISDNEYNDIRQILSLSLPQINIINIWRIQNVFLWQKFKNKQIALEKQYNDKFLNIQKLFHGIDAESVDDIVRENFEFRRHSETSSRPYGEGTYFYNSASAGARNCSPDSSGKNILLIAEVIIGKVAQGSSGLTRPPENPSYNAMYDSTTDNIQNPSVYVKYSTLEYYPAYIVEFI